MSVAKKKLKRVKQLIDEAKSGKLELLVLIQRIDAAISCQCREPLVKNNHCLKCTAHILKFN